MQTPGIKEQEEVKDTLSLSVRNVLKRAKQISCITWVPVGDIPSNTGFFSPGEEISGIPYSSVKEMDKFVGMDVSFTTFMTAVHNPRSVLYTENTGKAPYVGTNCASYYGTVCSSTINYVFDLKANYTTGMMDTLAFFSRVTPRIPEELQLCDVLWKTGHEIMVYGIEKNPVTSAIKSISVLESAAPYTSIRKYPVKDFVARMQETEWLVYRYNFEESVSYNPSPFIRLDDEAAQHYIYNDVLCPSRGDYAVYREGEDVTINLLNANYHSIAIYQQSKFVKSIAASSADVVIDGLPAGSYMAVASGQDGRRSGPVHFEVVDANVMAENDGGLVRVLFGSEYARPIYMSLCDKQGNRYMIKEFSDAEVPVGEVLVPFPEGVNECYCKVFFSTSNGTVTNVPVLVTR